MLCGLELDADANVSVGEGVFTATSSRDWVAELSAYFNLRVEDIAERSLKAQPSLRSPAVVPWSAVACIEDSSTEVRIDRARGEEVEPFIDLIFAFFPPRVPA